MDIKQITPPEAHTLLGQGYRYIDVRTEEEFANGHPATAVNIPVAVINPATGQMALNPDFVRVAQAHFPSDAKLIVGCQSGGRSQRAAEMMLQAGFTDVCNMAGGYGGMRDQMGQIVVAGWSESGLPVSRECGPDNAYAALRGAAR